MDNNKARELAAALRDMSTNGYVSREVSDEAATALETYAQEAAKWGEWRTMTDVPLDGSKIWLYSPETDLRYIAYWGRGYIQPKGFEVLEPADGWINAACFEPYIIDARISNWMPLPPKPLARAEKMGVV